MDITNILSHLESPAGRGSLAPVATRLARQADVNRDGNVGSAEVRDFLSKLAAAIDSTTPTEAPTTQQTPAPLAVTPPAPPFGSSMPASTMNALRALAAAVAKVR